MRAVADTRGGITAAIAVVQRLQRADRNQSLNFTSLEKILNLALLQHPFRNTHWQLVGRAEIVFYTLFLISFKCGLSHDWDIGTDCGPAINALGISDEQG